MRDERSRISRRMSRALRQRSCEPVVGATSSGWDVTIKLVELGLGVGVVNEFCEVPRTIVKRPLAELGRVSYFAFARTDARPGAKALMRAFLGARAVGRGSEFSFT